MNDGGPAFPETPKSADTNQSYVQGGMTLRDYFAAHATDADIEPFLDGMTAAGIVGPKAATYRAKARFGFADAMIAARQPTGEPNANH